MKPHRFDGTSFVFGVIFVLFGLGLAFPYRIFGFLSGHNLRYFFPALLIFIGLIMLLSSVSRSWSQRRREEEEENELDFGSSD